MNRKVETIGGFVISDEITKEALKTMFEGMDEMIDEMIDNSNTILITISQID